MGGKNIQIFYELDGFKVQKVRKIQQWLLQSAKSESKCISELNYIFCDDPYLLKINIEYLKHDYLTDIITFDYSDKSAEISGDIYISVDRAKENSVLFNERFDQELRRLMIHGLLHLIGYADKTDAEKKEMTTKEDLYLKLFMP